LLFLSTFKYTIRTFMRVTGEPSIIPLAEIPQTAFDGSPDLWSVAQDLQDICADPANQDLLLGFRPTVEAYSKPLNAVRERLLARQRKAQEHPDQFQSFLALVPQEYEQDVKIPSRLVVVGLGIITVLSEERRFAGKALADYYFVAALRLPMSSLRVLGPPFVQTTRPHKETFLKLALDTYRRA